MQKNKTPLKIGLASAVAVFGLFLLGSCTKDISTGAASRTPTEQAAAFQFTDNAAVPFELVDFIPCANGGAGEEVTFTGALHVLVHVTENANGFTIKTHFQPMGLKGVGAITGDIYNATGVTQDTQSGSFNNGSFTYNYANNYRLIGPGPDNNSVVHENYTITINANGTIAVERDNYSIDCK